MRRRSENAECRRTARREIGPARHRTSLGALARHALIALFLASAWAPRVLAAPSRPEPSNARGADALAAEPPSEARDRALERWAKERASLADLLFLLRRSPRELGGVEARLVAAALERAPRERAALRRRLAERMRLVDPKAKIAPADAPDAAAAVRPRASVFQVVTIAPDSGDYRDYGLALVAGVRAGLDGIIPPAGLPLQIEVGATSVGEPSRVLAAFDRIPEAGIVVGELLSVPTLVLATAARYAAVPMISPTATDEDLGLVSPGVFQIGPSGYLRGGRLARATLPGGSGRVGILVSNAVEGSSFAAGFAAVAESLGATIAFRDAYSSGSLNFHDEVKALMAARLDFLFWDGDAREAEALLRQLARERAALRLCGGGGLAPDLHHDETRTLLEGVQYVGEEWSFGDAEHARSDSLSLGSADDPVRMRGLLAGRMVRAALASGALCPEEVAAFLEAKRLAGPYLEARGFLDVSSEGVTVPVYAVRRGRSVRLP